MEYQLITTLALMFGGALACGALPFFLRVKEEHLQTMAALGAGLMIGSALAVIIPEGFHGFAESHAGSHNHDHNEPEEGRHDLEEGLPEGLVGLVLVLGFLAMLLLDHLQHTTGGSCGMPGDSHVHQNHSHSHGISCSASQERLRERSPLPRTKSGKKGVADNGDAAAATGSSDAGRREDNAAAEAAADCNGKGKGKIDASTTTAAAPPDPQSAVMGLLIHCTADGLAMGTAFLSGDARLTMLIATAMVLHKAPMAFGLSTYLVACQWSFQRSQRTLLLFAAAAPAATLATYTLLGSLALLSSPAAVSLCVIFSGGTFLYAATMHILPEVLQSSGDRRTGSAQLGAVVASSLLPVLLSWGHHH